jgi:TolB-like protein/cytochrome c-type biogenesis protein CcmH/NrfG
MTTGTEVYRFGEFVLDVSKRELSNGAGAVTLAPKAFGLLVALARRADRLVTKDELLTLVWPDASVEEGIIAVHISALRKALGDTHRSPKFIQTVAGTGYRFVARIERPAEAQPVPAPKPPVRFRSIAVLPFANLSGDPQNGYFSDGLTEEIIGALAQVTGLRVISRMTAFAFRGPGLDLRRIGADLGVETILEGSVRTSGSRIRVAVQLVDPVTGLHLWSQRYDRELSDVFAVQDDIAGSIAATLELALTEGQAVRPAPKPPLAAYEAYLKALHYRRVYNGEAMDRSRDWFQKAIELAPEYVPAHVGLGVCYLTMATDGGRSPHEMVPLARAAAQRALALDPGNPDAHAILGTIAFSYDYDVDAVEEAWRHVGVRPYSYMAVWFGTGYLAWRHGQMAGIELVGRALEVDPLNHLFRSIQAFTYAWLGMLDRALAVAQRCIELDETAPGGHFVSAIVYAERDMLPDALAAARRAYELMPWHPRSVGLLAATLERSGDCAGAAPLLASLRESRVPGAEMGMIQYHLIIGDVERAIPWFERAIDNRHPLVKIYALHPKMERLRADPQSARVLTAAGLQRSL